MLTSHHSDIRVQTLRMSIKSGSKRKSGLGETQNVKSVTGRSAPSQRNSCVLDQTVCYTDRFFLHTFLQFHGVNNATVASCLSKENQVRVCVISSFHRAVAKNCALLGYCPVISGNFLPTFRDNLSVPSLGVKNSKEDR